MAIHRTPWIDDDGSGTTGTVLNNAMKTGLYDEIDAAIGALGSDAWQDIAFVAANYTLDDASLYTVGQIYSRWRRIGTTTVIWECGLNPVTIPKTSQSLFISGLPFSLAGPANVWPIAWSNPTSFLTKSGAQKVALARSDSAAWAAGSTWSYWSVVLEAT